MKHTASFTAARDAFAEYRAALLQDMDISIATESRLKRISDRSRMIFELMDDLQIDIDQTHWEDTLFSQLEPCGKCDKTHEPLITCYEYAKGMGV